MKTLAQPECAARVDGVRPIFPLRVTPFEALMLADDRPSYPMLFVFELVFSGTADRAAWDRAFEQTLDRHPLLTALIRGSGTRARWIAGNDQPRIDWGPIDAPLVGYGGSIDLRTRAGILVWGRGNEETTRLVFQFHHACCDGLGALQFFNDLLAAYAALCPAAAAAPSLKELDPQMLTRRAVFGEPGPKPSLRELGSQVMFGLREARRLFRETPPPLAAPPVSAANRAAAPTLGVFRGDQSFVRCTLPANVVAGLRSAGVPAKATVNDLLLRDFLLTLRAWNRRQGRTSPDERLRIMMPCNLRTREHEAMSAANVIGYAFLTRQARDCDDRRALLASVRDETELIRKHRLGLYFVGGLGLVSHIPFGLSLMLQPKRTFASAYLTNIGDPSRLFAREFPRSGGRVIVGNLTLEEIIGIPPVRPGTRVACSVVTYANQITLGVQCDPHHFSPAAAAELANLFGEHARKTAANLDTPPLPH